MRLETDCAIPSHSHKTKKSRDAALFRFRLCKKISARVTRSVSGNACDRRRWRIKGARVGAAAKIGSADRRARRFWAPREGLQRNFEPFCPCHRRRGLCIVCDDFSCEKSSARLTMSLLLSPKNLRLFRGPINFRFKHWV